MTRVWNVSLGIAFAIAGAAVSAQVGAPPSSAVRLTFDVASIKENHSVAGGSNTSGIDAGRYTATNIPLYFLVATTLKLSDHQLAGMPDWTWDARYDIAATYPPGLRPNEQEILAMVGSLLEERFKLTAHHEMREMPVYTLSLARGDGRLGPGMTSSNVDCAKWIADGRPQVGGGGPSAIAPGGKRPECLMLAGRRGTLTAGSRPVKELASALQSFVGRPVVDETGLAGLFNMDMQWTPSAADAAAPVGAPAPTDIGVSLFTALREQLGLKLEPSRASFDVAVVDHIERPSEN